MGILRVAVLVSSLGGVIALQPGCGSDSESGGGNAGTGGGAGATGGGSGTGATGGVATGGSGTTGGASGSGGSAGVAGGGVAGTAGGTGKPCGGKGGNVCDTGEWCDYPGDMCGVGDALGECKLAGANCSTQCTPVCGCDGYAYCNLCHAHAAGFDSDGTTSCISKNGAVGAPCGVNGDCQSGLDCCFGCGVDGCPLECTAVPCVGQT
jgi:hypothetical protein